MTKSTKILILTLFMMVALLGVNFLARQNSSAYAINQYAQIEVNKTADGYSYGNGDSFKTTDTLQQVFDDVLSEEVTANAIFNFNNISTSDTVVIDATRKVVISGTVKFEGATSDTFITLQGGALQFTGAIINSDRGKILEIKGGCEFVMESGNLSVFGDISGLIQSSVVNRGKTTLKGGVISYESTVGTNTGYAMSQFDSTASLTIAEGNAVQLYGSSALLIGGGEAVINGGIFVGNSDSVSENGSALKVRNDAKVTINGGVFRGEGEDRVVIISGSREGYIDFLGGTIEGKVLFGKESSANGARLKIDGKSILPTGEGLVEVSSSVLDEALTPTNAMLNVRTQEGYYVKEWSGIAKATPLVSEFSNGALIWPTLSNEYLLTLVVDGEEHDFNVYYGSIVDPKTLGVILPNGYEVYSWLDSSDSEVPTPFRVTSNVKYTAKLGVKAVEIGEIADVNKVYDGEVESRTIPVQRVEGLTYSAQWEGNTVGIWSPCNTGDSISFVSVADSGRYRVRVTVSDGVTQKESLSNEFKVEIVKATYGAITHPELNGVYDALKTLDDYALQEGFTWVQATVKPTVPVKEYDATYCADSVNYNPIVVKITLNLQKASAVTKSHNPIANRYVYDEEKTLADYPFESGSGWRWSDVNVIPTAGTKEYSACYNPDVDNYEDYITTVTLVIGKATYVAVEDVYLTVSYVNGLTLGSVLEQNAGNLTGYRLAQNADKSTLLNQCKVFEFNAVYNADSENYKDYNSVKIFVTVTKGSNTVDYNATNTINAGVYDPERTLQDIALNSPYWHWQSPQTVPTVTQSKYNLIYNPDASLFDDYILEVTVIVDKADLQSVVHRALSGTYSKDKTLSDYALDSGWSWQNGTIVPTVDVGSYQAVYDGGANYNLYYGEILLTLSKAKVDVTGITLSPLTVTYDGKAHSLAYSGTLPQGVSVTYYNNGKVNAGNYVVEMAFSQSDLINYLPIAPMSAQLTIGKATAEIVAQEVYEFVYNGEVRMPNVTIDNTEQVLRYELSGELKEVGEYSIRYYVSESANYTFQQRTVKVIINPQSIAIGSVYGSHLTSFIGKVSEGNLGIAIGSTLTIPIENIAKQEITFKVLIDGQAKMGNFTVNLLIPDDMAGSNVKLYKLIDGEYQEVAVTVSGNYYIFNTDSLGTFRLTTDKRFIIDENNSMEWWAWLLIATAVATIICTVVVALIMYKKGKLSIDKVKKVLVKLKVKSRSKND